MVSINYSSREVCCKIVFYGPGLSGKTTNLQYVHAKVPQNSRGKLISLATEADRTLYFDFLPINIGSINGFQAKFQLYTVPGQVYYNATRKLVLRGVDGVVFVADSQSDKQDENMESLLNLEENLQEYGYNINEIPVVIQYNKRDLPNVLTVEQLNANLNKRGWPHFEASATIGNGVFDTLKLIIKLVLEKAKSASPATVRPSATDLVGLGSGKIRTVESAPTAAVTPPPVAPVHVPQPKVADSGPIALESIQSKVIVNPSYEAGGFRPYPGSERGGRPAAVAEPHPAREHSAPYPAMSSDISPVSEPHEEYTSRAKTSPPQMAPSLRKKGETKKRGFFKRLFGIK